MFAFPRSSLRFIPFAILAVTACPIPAAEAGLIFDNTDSLFNSTSVSFSGLGAKVAVSASTTIGDIAVKTNSTSNVIYKFVIFDEADTSAPVYLSGPKSFADAAFLGFTEKMSDDFNFTLLAGHTYDIGAITSTSAFFVVDQNPESQNGITSSATSRIVSNYANPQIGNLYASEAQIQLFSATAVPEPSSLAMTMIAIPAGLAWARKQGRRTRPAA